MAAGFFTSAVSVYLCQLSYELIRYIYSYHDTFTCTEIERERERRERERDLDTKLLEVLLYHVPLCQGAMDNVLKLSTGPLIKSASVEVSSCFEIDINI